MKKIIVEINPDGSIKAETEGVVGPMCITEVKEILKGVEYNEDNIEKKQEYYSNNVEINNQISIHGEK